MRSLFVLDPIFQSSLVARQTYLLTINSPLIVSEIILCKPMFIHRRKL